MYEQAVADVAALKEAAVENAKSVLMEALSSKMNSFIESQMNEADEKDEDKKEDKKMDEQLEMYEMSADGHGDHEEELPEAAGRPDMNMEAADEDVECKCNDKDEDGDDEDDDEDGGDMDEVVELTPESLQAAVSEMLGTAIKEAMVTKGFGDVENVADGTGLLDVASGDKMFNDVEPPHAEDNTVKESAKVKAYKKALTEASTKIAELRKVNAYLQENLGKVTLFSSKLLYTNKIFAEAQNLSQKHRMKIVEAIDTAENLSEVKKIYKSLSESLKIAGVVSEGKVATKAGTSAKASRVTTPGSTLIRESIKRDEQNAGGVDKNYLTRLQELAGLIK